MASHAVRTLIYTTRSPLIQQFRNTSKYSKKAPVTIDDLPVPKGSWKEHYDKTNRTYNLQLAVGTVAMVSTILYIANSDVFIWNYFPPTLPKK